MIDQVNKNIQRYVDIGDYFTDARQWYAYKYLLPYTLRTLAFIFFAIAALAAYIMFNLYQQESEVKIQPFPMFAYDSVNYYPRAKPISNVKEPINISVARYLSSEYIKFRESYNFKNLENETSKTVLRNKIKSLSSRKVYNEYLDYIDPVKNPNSPIIIYKDTKEIEVQIDSVELMGQWDFPETAKITFSKIENDGDNKVVTKWNADISFTMLDLDKKNENGSSNLSFTITYYKTYML